MNCSRKRALNDVRIWFLLIWLMSSMALAGCAVKTSAPVPNSTASIELSLFKASSNCAACHQGLKDSAGNDVSIHAEWHTSIMANAARDPYYLASVRMETQNSPEYADAIEEKCATCHMPMARFTNTATRRKTLLLGEQGVLAKGHPLNQLAVDGVSCAVCHQIPKNPADNLRNSGDLGIDLNLSADERFIYGALAISEQNANLMKAASGYTPVQSEHVRESILCASCHELYLNYVKTDGTLSTGEDLFYEQTPYSEWLASSISGQSSCQNCHMPPAEGAAPVSNLTPQNLVQPFARHTFTGGNVFMLSLFRQFGKEQDIPGNLLLFDEHIQRTRYFLQNQTATLVITSVEQGDDAIVFSVGIEVLTGHKFPTSFPSRRSWLHVTVSDAQGKLIFESGGYDPAGKINGNENDEDPCSFEPHYDVISSPDQVQIYEPVMRDAFGKVTTTQMHAAGYLKDNRLLPPGFDKQNAPLTSAVIGDALQDQTFTGGGDTLNYELKTGGAQGPFTVQVDLLYQTVSYRWAKNVMDSQSGESQSFERMVEQAGIVPVVIATQTTQIR